MGSIQCCQLIVAVVATVLLTITVFVGGCYGPSDVRIALGLFLIVLNLATAVVFWLDKWAARNNHYRVAEIVLHYLTFFGAPIGAIFGMYMPCCRHKTEKRSFIVVTFVLGFVNVCWVFVYFIATAKTSLSACYR